MTSETESERLEGTRVGVSLAPEGTEEVEFTEPNQAVSDAGARVDVLGVETGEADTVNDDLDPGDTYEVERSLSEVSPDEYDALIVPGGTVDADKLRVDDDAVELLREHVAADRPVGVICHGPWTLVEADVVDGRTLTSYPSPRIDVHNAGGEWVDEEVVTDGGVVSSRNPDDLPAFCETIVEEFAAGAE
ncbi:type 1 glutamine amidotransferase [Halorarum halophilum]|uniref:Type 1 glutamine amidotransferase n=1 Tax=Halorarum halophilum TaxID=2743090 RepID=A0A7D5KXH5_9EURY|nr:type 1 glutamine amidotransferase domain-containing protein [Halobaculum halophilum]QLG28238.1 type 1 glutamine amidotransferase [Halobaculum halophilum]